MEEKVEQDEGGLIWRVCFLTSFPEISSLSFPFYQWVLTPCVCCVSVSSPLWCVWNSALVKKKTKLQDKWSAGFCNLSNSKFWILAPYWRPFAAPHGGKLWFGCRIFAKLSNAWPTHEVPLIVLILVDVCLRVRAPVCNSSGRVHFRPFPKKLGRQRDRKQQFSRVVADKDLGPG